VIMSSGWARYVRQQNLSFIGEAADLQEFLFGTERNNLATVRPTPLDRQHGRWFYCNHGIVGERRPPTELHKWVHERTRWCCCRQRDGT
jgi:hypothetical protein